MTSTATLPASRSKVVARPICACPAHPHPHQTQLSGRHRRRHRAVSDLNALSGKHLLPSFDDEDDNAEQIASTVQEIAGLFKELEWRLKEMASCKSEGSGDEVRYHAPATAAT